MIPYTSVADLQAELFDRQRERYRRLQRAALDVAFERKVGRPPADLAEIRAAYPGQDVMTVRPERYLTQEQITRLLTSTATGVISSGVRQKRTKP